LKLDIPARELVVRKEPPFFSNVTFEDIDCSREMRGLFLDYLAEDKKKSSSSLLGSALLSAILFGGLLDDRWWEPWLQSAVLLNCVDDYCWLNLQREVKTKVAGQEVMTDIQQRHWPVDPLTEILLRRWLSEVKKVTGQTATLSLNEVLVPCLRPIQISSIKVLKKQLPDVAKLLANSGVPIELVHFSVGKSPGTSLPATAWHRLLTNRPITLEADIAKDEIHDEFEGVVEALGAATWLGQDKGYQETLYHKFMPLISSVANTVKGDRSVLEKCSERLAAIEVFVSKHEKDIAPALALLISWACDLLRGKSAGKDFYRPTSVRRFLQTFGETFISYADTEDPLEYDPDDFLDCYLELIQRHIDNPKTKHEYVFCAKTLIRFHKYLVIVHKAPQIPLQELHASGEGSVNANLLTLQEFDKLVKALKGKNQKLTRTRQMTVLIAILAFRCGLRKKEIRSLLIRDLDGFSNPSLWVRSNSIATNKTRASRRWLQLYSLLTNEERLALIAWRDSRIAECLGGTDSLLFASVENPKLMLSSSPCFSTITNLMHQVSGDKSLHFHHLRHSAANWFFLRLCGGVSVMTHIDIVKHEMLSDESCDKLKREYLGGQNAGRNVLFAVAIFLGHASPSTSACSYLHFSDWVLWKYLSSDEVQPLCDRDLAMKLSNLKIARLSKISTKRDGANLCWHASDLLKSVRGATRIVEVQPQNLKRKDARVYIPLIDGEKLKMHESWQQIVCALDEYSSGRKFKVIARRRGVPQSVVVNWVANAKNIEAMRTRGQKNEPGKLRHVWGNVSQGNKLLRLPRSKEEKDILTRMWDAFHGLGPDEKKHTRANIQLFLEKFSHYRPMVRFAQQREMKAYLKFLRLIKLPHDLIHIAVFSSGKEGVLTSVEKTDISMKFGVVTSQITEEPRALGKRDEMTLAVKVGQCSDSGRFVASRAFRCFVYLCVISSKN